MLELLTDVAKTPPDDYRLCRDHHVVHRIAACLPKGLEPLAEHETPSGPDCDLIGIDTRLFCGFAVVSLYTRNHRFALVAALIAGIGDEAFVMLVRMPEQTIG